MLWVTREESFANSSNFVDGLDRAALGEFALPRESLVKIDRYLRTIAYKDEFRFAGEEDFENELGDVVLSNHISFTELLVEIIFWWMRSDDEKLLHYTRNTSDSDIFYMVDRLTAAYDHPEMHSYFSAGIWDVDVVQHCIENDIDPVLAAAVQV